MLRPGPPEFTEELRLRSETDGVLLESYLIYEPEHQVNLIYEPEHQVNLIYEPEHQVNLI